MFSTFKTHLPTINPKIQQLALGIIVLLLGITIGFFIKNNPKIAFSEIRTKHNTYQFINPLLECENASFENFNNLSSMQSKVEKRIEIALNNGEAQHVSLYYRDLNNGPWFGINETEEFAPASLLKVPVMLALYKQAEVDPAILDKKITISNKLTYADVNFVPQQKLISGETYSIKELLERMIIDSDNYAYDILEKEVDQNILTKVYTDVGIELTQINDDDPSGNIISVRDYAKFFRILFNASYISNEYSEEALTLLSRSTFKKGLPAGVDQSTLVAHKFGERYFAFSGVRQLHDCGIIYHPKRPYLLCVMTKGAEFSELSKIIQDISKVVFDESSK